MGGRRAGVPQLGTKPRECREPRSQYMDGRGVALRQHYRDGSLLAGTISDILSET